MALRVGLLVPVLVLMYSPLLGLAFVGTLILSGAIVLVPKGPWVLYYFSLAWKMYVGLAIFTFAFLTTFHYREGVFAVRFVSYMKHTGWRFVGEDFLGSLIWPLVWFRLDQILKEWETTFGDMVLDVLRFWFMKGRSVTVICIDMRPEEEYRRCPTTLSWLLTLEETLAYGGQVLKFTLDGGATWRYVLVSLDPRLIVYHSGSGVPADSELVNGTSHLHAPIMDYYFGREGFRLMTTTPEEIAGKVFSYSDRKF